MKKMLVMSLAVLGLLAGDAYAWGEPTPSQETLPETPHTLTWYLTHGYRFMGPIAMSSVGGSSAGVRITRVFLENQKGGIIYCTIDEDQNSRCYTVVGDDNDIPKTQ